MHSLTDPLTFPCPISVQARHKAEDLRLHQANPDKATRIYFNTLAVYAVNAYLQAMGFETDLEASDSQDLVMASLCDTADLIVKDLGKLECLPVLPGIETVDIPEEVWQERLGYVAVQFDADCRVATLLGFLPAVSTEAVSITHLQSLDQFLEYLEGVRLQSVKALAIAPSISSENPVQTRLSQWLEGRFEEGWETIQALFSNEFGDSAIALRNALKGSAQISTKDFTAGKLFNLSLQLENRSLLLLIGVMPKEEGKVRVFVRVCSAEADKRLPAHIGLAFIRQSGEEMNSVQKPYEQDFIQLLPFTLRSGTSFAIRVSYQGTSITEPFIA